MSDTDRLISYGLRILDDACDHCRFSKVYCHAVTYTSDEPDTRCCPACSH